MWPPVTMRRWQGMALRLLPGQDAANEGVMSSADINRHHRADAQLQIASAMTCKAQHRLKDPT
ncbi:hypothetical protein [Xanthomonas cassavae]|uniref:hypothetical protein n=1 Tax=Xanthomonas cassavae TaxID=56450 RepID=UPI001267DC7F|nr:hypothetical protein [Xanthomonas cassavae]